MEKTGTENNITPYLYVMNEIEITIAAIRHILIQRYYNSERGFVTELSHYLHDENLLGLFPPRTIIETEAQKNRRAHYGVRQRPDMIVHIPKEEGVTEHAYDGNFIVYACKVEATVADAQEDFIKLDEMFNALHYPLGIFINIGGYPDSLLHHYRGIHRDRIHELSIRLVGNRVDIQHSHFENGVIHHE
jgi:hypothetical protein